MSGCRVMKTSPKKKATRCVPEPMPKQPMQEPAPASLTNERFVVLVDVRLFAAFIFGTFSDMFSAPRNKKLTGNS